MDSILKRLKLASTTQEVKHLGFITLASGMPQKDRDKVIQELVKRYKDVE